MIVYKIAKASAPYLDDKLEMELLHDLECLRFLSAKHASDYVLHLLADNPKVDFKIDNERFPGLYDGDRNRVYLRQGSSVAAYYASRLGFIDLREVVLTNREEMSAELKDQWDRFSELAEKAS